MDGQRPPEVVYAPYSGFMGSETQCNIVYMESPLSIDPSLPQLKRPPWLTNFKTQIGPPIQATPNSRRYPAPSSQDPLTIFRPMTNACSVPASRWVNIGGDGLAMVLIFTDGAAINNGQPNARAGCGIVFVPANPRPKGVSFSLEAHHGLPTCNRAELLAAINALTLRVWIGEGFARIAIATDSDYVVRGICEYVFSWKQTNWKTSRGTPVVNRDLWECLFRAVERWESSGVMVQFYLIKREFNTEADRLAKGAAKKD